MVKHKIIPGNILEGICKVLAETINGFSGSELEKLLNDSKIPDTDPELKKSKRLYNAFVKWQNINQYSNSIWDFISKAMAPVRYLNKEDLFETRRTELNKVLAFEGVSIANTGKFQRKSKVSTIKEAEKRANNLLNILKERNVHADVLKFCKAELLEENYFHAVFETTKSVADKIRFKTGLTSDGAGLVDMAFSIKNPWLRINALKTETEESEHKGFANLLKGFFGTFRNTTGHDARIKWEVTEEDALDIMTFASFFHRRLDKAN